MEPFTQWATSSNYAVKWLAYSPQTPMGSVETIHNNCCRKPRRHNARKSPQAMRNHFRRLTLRARRPYRGLGWHPTGTNYSYGPIHATEMPSSACSTRLVTTIIDLAALNGPLHRAKCHYKLLFRQSWFTTDCRFNAYQAISLGSFYNDLNLRWNCCAFLLCSMYKSPCIKNNIIVVTLVLHNSYNALHIVFALWFGDTKLLVLRLTVSGIY